MNEVATELLKDVLDAYAQGDEERAREVWERDVELDALEDSGLPRPSDSYDGGSAQHLVLRASALLLKKHRADRRSCDQIAETVVYLVSGRSMPLDRPHGRQETDIDIEGTGGAV
jgi:phosphate transport system protein